MKGLKSSLFFAILSLLTVLMISNAHGQMSQQEAMNHVQQYRDAGVIQNIDLILDTQIISVTVDHLFHEMTPKQKYDFALLLSRSYPWKIISVTDTSTGKQIYRILGSPGR